MLRFALVNDHQPKRQSTLYPRGPITFWEWEWNLNTLLFGGDYTPQSSSDKVIGSLGLKVDWWTSSRRLKQKTKRHGGAEWVFALIQANRFPRKLMGFTKKKVYLGLEKYGGKNGVYLICHWISRKFLFILKMYGNYRKWHLLTAGMKERETNQVPGDSFRDLLIESTLEVTIRLTCTYHPKKVTILRSKSFVFFVG